MILTPKQQDTAIRALRIAAERLDIDAKYCRKQIAVAAIFKQQAIDARELADAMIVALDNETGA